MEKSTHDGETSEKSEYKPPLIWEIATAEGGIAVLIIYPLVVLFFLKMAYSSFG